jgi:hypothetical protein
MGVIMRLGVMASFGDVDLDFSVGKVDIEASSIYSDAVGVGVEDVADDLPVRKGVVGNVLLHSS